MPTELAVTRAGAILAVADVRRSIDFYVGTLGFELEAEYDDPPYATLSRAGMRLSLAEQGHSAEDRPGVLMNAPADTSSLQVVLVLEMSGVEEAYESLLSDGVQFLAEPYSPPWGGHRCFVVDPDGYLVELEEPA
jgi:catechol 2,3-dioxygenase-like lactoylglutathione lyase family enzyme